MRDDIHKRVQLTRTWKRCVRAALRPLDREFAGDIAGKAVVEDLRREVRPAFIAHVCARAAESLLPAADLARELEPAASSPLERLFVDLFRAERALAAAAVEPAWGATLHSRLGQVRRAVDGAAADEPYAMRAVVRREVDRALSSARDRTPDLARQLSSGRIPDPVKARKPALALDDDLLGGLHG